MITCFGANARNIINYWDYWVMAILCKCVVWLCYSVCFPSVLVALIRGMLVIVWLRGRPSPLGEEAETGEGCRAVCQHPATSHLSCHLRYASHGIQSACRPAEHKAGCSQLSDTNSLPLLIGLDLNTMWTNKGVGALTFLTFVQICTNMKRGSDEEFYITEVFTMLGPNLHSIVCTGLCSVSVCKCNQYWHTFFCIALVFCKGPSSVNHISIFKRKLIL